MKGINQKKKCPSKKVVTIDLSHNADYQSIKYNFMNSFKKNDKKKQIELKSKIDIQMNNNKGITHKSDKLLKRIVVGSPVVNLNLQEDKKNVLPSFSMSKEKHKKTISEIHYNLSNLETSEKEDEEEKVIKYSNTCRKTSKLINLKPYCMKLDKDFKEHKTSMSKFYRDKEFCIKSNRNMTENISISRTSKNFISLNNVLDNRVEYELEKDLKLSCLLEKYNKLTIDFDFLNKTIKENNKVIEILKAIILGLRNSFDNIIKNENANIIKLENQILVTKEENVYLKKKNTDLRFLVVNLFNKIREFENEEINRIKDQKYNMSLILKENEYLRKCNESVIRNNITIPDNTSCHINDKIYIDEKKKRRRATSVSLEYNSEGEIKTSYELDQHSYIANNNIIKLEEESLYSNRRSSKKYFTLQSLINTSNSEIEVKDSQEIIKNSSNEETNYYRNKLDSSQTNVKPRNQYLFFKTPKENEKKKIDYTYFDELNKVVNEAEKPNI